MLHLVYAMLYEKIPKTTCKKAITITREKRL